MVKTAGKDKPKFKREFNRRVWNQLAKEAKDDLQKVVAASAYDDKRVQSFVTSGQWY